MNVDRANADGSRSHETARILGLILSVTAARIYLAASVPILASEAYYWLWGQHLALGYVDHPPMVAWMSQLGFGWIAGSQLAARSSAIILSAATTMVVYALAKQMFGRLAAWRGAALFSIIPIFQVGAVLLQPDNSLAFFCALTWLFSWRAINENQSSRRRVLALWVATGAAAGLALLSKFHAWVLLPPLYLFLMLSSEHRRQLARPGPWIALAIALLVLSPNLIWNASHGWLTYAYQTHRSGLEKPASGIGHFVEYAFGPALTLSPFVYAGMIAAAWKAVRLKACRSDPAILFLACAGLPLPLFLGVLSTRVSISLHWPSTAYIPLLILLVGMMDRGLLPASVTYRRMWIMAWPMALALLLAPTVARLVPAGLAAPWRSEEINSDRLRREFVAWGDLGDHVRGEREALLLEGPAVVMTSDSHLAALLAFHGRMPEACFVLTAGKEHSFETWRAERSGLLGANAIAVFPFTKMRRDAPIREAQVQGFKRYLAPLFDQVAEPSYFAYRKDGETETLDAEPQASTYLRAFVIFKCRDFGGELARDYPRAVHAKSASATRRPGEASDFHE